jgi:Helix-turn-helix domain
VFPEGVTPSPSHTVTERDASQYIGLTVAFLRKARQLGRGPAYLRIGRTIRYRIKDLDAWLEQYRVKTRESA